MSAIPNKEDLQQIINKYKTLNLQGISMPKLMAELRADLRFFPFTTALMKKGGTIERARINKNGEIFTSENQLSYRTDISNITRFGRANVPHSSMFYGSIVSEKIQNPRIVNLFETEEIFRSAGLENASLTLTVGKWRIKQDFEVAEIVFSKVVRDKIPTVKKSFEAYVEKLKQNLPSDYEYYIKVLEFFADEFSKSIITTDHDYKLSAACTELALIGGLFGVTYPSVRTNYEGMNVALTIPAVEQFLDLEVVGMFEVHKNGSNSLMTNAQIAKDLGSLKSSFKWEKLPNLTEEQVNQILFDMDSPS